jgi:hypothetical protein
MAWTKAGNIRGPQGPKGDTGSVGPQGEQGPIGLTGQTGPKGDTGAGGATGPTGPQGPQGVKGDHGTGLNVLSAVATADLLPTTGNTPGDAHMVTSTGNLHIWGDDGTWHELGHVQGPAGPAGAAGAQGPQGEQGVAGTHGSVIMHGDGPPQANTGVNGDYWINQTDSTVWGPKTDAGWGSAGFSIKGATGSQGPAGARGSAWFTGPGAPTTVDGSVAGDLYLDTSSGDVYRLD